MFVLVFFLSLLDLRQISGVLIKMSLILMVVSVHLGNTSLCFGDLGLFFFDCT